MTTATLTRPVTTCKHLYLVEECGRLRLQIAGKGGRNSKWYVVTPLASDFGDAYRLTACCGDRLAGGAESHEVLLDGRRSSCTCAGHTFTGGCKHVSALMRLKAEGRV